MIHRNDRGHESTDRRPLPIPRIYREVRHQSVTRTLLAVAVVSTVAGCLGAPERSSTDVPPSTEQSPSLRFELYSKATANVSVRVVNVSGDGNETVLEASYPPDAGEIGLNDVLADDTHYRVTVAVGGTVAWSRPVYDYEGYRLVVRENGTVREETHVEV